MARILIPLPRRDSDPSEVAVSWRTLHDDGHQVIFATPDGQPAAADALMVSGAGLDPWGWLPGLNRLRLVGLLLRANADARKAYAALLQDAAFRAPLRWDALSATAFDGLLLPGGHRARGAAAVAGPGRPRHRHRHRHPRRPVARRSPAFP